MDNADVQKIIEKARSNWADVARARGWDVEEAVHRAYVDVRITGGYSEGSWWFSVPDMPARLPGRWKGGSGTSIENALRKLAQKVGLR